MMPKNLPDHCFKPNMSGKNRRLVADKQVGFEKSPVEVGDFRRFTDRFRGVYRIYHNFNKGKPDDVNK